MCILGKVLQRQIESTMDMNYPHSVHGHELLATFVILFVILSQHSSLSQGKTFPNMTSDVEEVSGKSFDYIVVGGGTAGCPVAATLSERFSVLLIERGGSPYGDPLVSDKVKWGYSLLQADEFSSVAQSFTSKDGRPVNFRGRALGGSTAINGGLYGRASDDFIERVGWDKEMVKNAYEWVESKLVFNPSLTKWQTLVKFGLLEAGILPYNGFTLEHIVGTKVTGATFDEYGKRRTSADLLDTGNPENLTVLLNATVSRIIFNRNGNKSIVRGIAFIKSDGSTKQIYEAYLKQPNNSNSRGDVILSAGPLGSPQILLLSGIGPRQHLKKFNIPLVLDLKGVGEDMRDPPTIPFPVDHPSEYRLPDPPQVAGITKYFKFVIEANSLPKSFNTSRASINVKLASPQSKGKLELNNTDPRQNPLVQFNYLEEEKDLDQCVKMVQLNERIARSKSGSLFLGIKPQNNLKYTSDELRDFCKNNFETFSHYHGGCIVGSVVDNDYKVYGVDGLRVIDFSTFLESPGTNPMATILMLGRYQGVKILKERQGMIRHLATNNTSSMLSI